MRIGFFIVSINAKRGDDGYWDIFEPLTGLGKTEFPIILPATLCFSIIAPALQKTGDYEYFCSIRRDGDDKNIFEGLGSITLPKADLSAPTTPYIQPFAEKIEVQFDEPGIYTVTFEVADDSKSHVFYLLNIS